VLGDRELWLGSRHRRDAAEAKSDLTLSQSFKKNWSDVSSTLRQACDEFGRPDLEEPLSWIINLEPRNRDVESLLAVGGRANLSIAANAMTYEGKFNEARDYFKRDLELTNPNSRRYQHIAIVLANFDDVVKIAERYWELTGKGKASEHEKSIVSQIASGLSY
jgi:tetratricopeptide (TPR) repeat protein